jgi:hypothetical protein
MATEGLSEKSEVGMRRSFPIGVAEKLEYYIYRLIDPRNGETFYVGKGRGDRIFQHANGALKPELEEDALDTKMQRIRDIRSAGLEVGHVIHRHGIKDEQTAFQIEAAVIDAYPGLANRVGGHSTDFGVAHVEELVTLYAAEPFVPRHRLLLISIRNSYKEGKTIYDAVRYAWALDPDKARRAEFVLAHVQGLVKGVFKPTKWMESTAENFPSDALPGRWGFEGEEASETIRKQYIGKRVPDKYRPKGAANPVRYVFE